MYLSYMLVSHCDGVMASESFQADVILLRDLNLLSFLIKILLLYGTERFSYAPGIIIMIIGMVNVLKF